jgi:hypothetical protein
MRFILAMFFACSLAAQNLTIVDVEVTNSYSLMSTNMTNWASCSWGAGYSKNIIIIDFRTNGMMFFTGAKINSITNCVK